MNCKKGDIARVIRAGRLYGRIVTVESSCQDQMLNLVFSSGPIWHCTTHGDMVMFDLRFPAGSEVHLPDSWLKPFADPIEGGTEERDIHPPVPITEPELTS